MCQLRALRKKGLKGDVMGGRGGSSGFGNGSIYSKLDIPQNNLKGKRFDASKLEGSEKQIQYAQSIINDAYNTADNEIERAIDSIKYYYANRDKYGYEQLAYSAAKARVFTESKKKLDETLNKTKTASGVIKNKNAIQSVLPQIRETLEQKYRKEYEEKYKKKFKK